MTFKRHAVLAVVCVFALTLAVVSDNATTPNPVDSVVTITDGTGFGSGVIVGPSSVLTAKHLYDGSEMTVHAADGDTHKVVSVKLDKDDDLVVLVIDGTFDEEPLIVDKTPLQVGDEITVIGTPFGNELFNSVLIGHIVKVDVDTPLGTGLDIHDAHSGPGCSGSPVLDKSGHVRAIHSISIYGTLSGAVPVEKLDEL